MKKIYLLSIMVFSYIQADSQCINTRTININTGIDINNNLITPPNTQDPYWEIWNCNNILGAPVNGFKASSLNGSAGLTMNTINGNSNAISFSSPISFLPASVNTPYFYNITFRRRFVLCKQDNINFNLDIAKDNYLNGIYVDGQLITSPSTIETPTAGSYISINYNFNVNHLYAGTHTIDIIVCNFSASYNNPMSLMVAGKLTSLCDSSLVTNNSSLTCCCAKDTIKYNNINGCTLINMVPKILASSLPNLTCSQIYDNGTSVGIGTTTGFTYTSLSGGTLGNTLPLTSGNIKLEVNGVLRSLASVVTSDANYKTEIKPIIDPMNIIKSIEGKTYMWNHKGQEKFGADNGLHVGFIAQDLQKIIPEIVIKDENGDLAVNYNELIPILNEAIKKQQIQIDNLTRENNEVKSKLNELINCCNISQNNELIQNNILYQNIPNPFSNSTIITYLISKFNENAFVIIYDLNGKEIHRYPITNIGKGELIIKGDDYIAGIYLYSLIIDSKEIDTKRMVLNKN